MLAFIDLETRVPPEHPLRVIKKLADQALKALSPDLDRMYAEAGRPLRLRSGQAFDSPRTAGEVFPADCPVLGA